MSKQKHALRTILIPALVSELRYIQIMTKIFISNIYQLNIHNVINLMYQLNVHNVLNIMFKVKNGLIPDAFQNKFHLISHDCFTKSSMHNFKEPN